MRKGIVPMFVGLLLLLVIGCVSYEVKIQEQGARQMSQSELETLFSKYVEIQFKASGVNGSQKFNPDGTTSLVYGVKTDTGTYRFVEGLYCSTWENLRTTEKCWKMYKINDKELRIVELDGSSGAIAFIK